MDNLINNSEKVSDSIICNHKNAIADSGCTNQYVCITTPYTHVDSCTDGIQAKQPDVTIMTATHTALIDSPHLPSAVRHAHIFPQMHKNIIITRVILQQQL